MKKTITALSIIGLLISTALYSSIDTKSNLYPATFTVTAIDEENNTITLEDFNGFTWEYEGVEDWFIGDTAAALMDSNGTALIFDDTIEQLRYTGYTY